MSAVDQPFAELARIALHARVEAAMRARMERSRLLSEARDAIRKAGIRSNCELLAVLQTVHGAVGPQPIADTALNTFSDRLLELVTDYDDEWNGGEE